MEPTDTEKIIKDIAGILVSEGVLVMTANYGYALASSFAVIAARTVMWLLELLFEAGRRIVTAIRERSPEDSLIGVICREIIAIASDSVDAITECVMAIIAFLRETLEKGADFIEKFGQKSLELTRGSSVKRD